MNDLGKRCSRETTGDARTVAAARIYRFTTRKCEVREATIPM
jgi:hypothetical protein